MHFTSEGAWKEIKADGAIKPSQLTEESKKEIENIPFFKSIGAISVFNFKKEYIHSNPNDFKQYIDFDKSDLSPYEKDLLHKIEYEVDLSKKDLLWHKHYMDKAQSFWGKINSSNICLIFNDEITSSLLGWREKHKHKRNGLVIPCLEMGYIGEISTNTISEVIRLQ